MKIVWQALIGAAAVHVIYFTTTFVIGYVKTVIYRPNIAMDWENVDMLQNEVAFGHTASPFFYLCTFLGTALLCGLLLISYKKIISRHLKVD